MREEDIDAMVREYEREGLRINSFLLIRDGMV